MRLFGLIGYPLTHSFSQRYFTTKFEANSWNDCAYRNFAISNIEQLDSILTMPDLVGLNVTIPYKKAVLAYLTERSEVVDTIQSCNCIYIQNGLYKGYNTDVAGFEQSIKPYLRPQHKQALILGTGGSSASVRYVLQQLGITALMVSRTPQGSSAIAYAALTEAILDEHLLIVNTTPLGMFPAIESCPPIPYQFIGTRHLLFDLTYNPAETQFLKLGKQKGAAICNGANMLSIQAEASWKIWNP